MIRNNIQIVCLIEPQMSVLVASAFEHMTVYLIYAHKFDIDSVQMYYLFSNVSF